MMQIQSVVYSIFTQSKGTKKRQKKAAVLVYRTRESILERDIVKNTPIRNCSIQQSTRSYSVCIAKHADWIVLLSNKIPFIPRLAIAISGLV